MSKPAIRVNQLGKEFRIAAVQSAYPTLRTVLVDSLKAPFVKAARLMRGEASSAAGLFDSLWALQDIEFEIKEGTILGVIGRNGAGKSTLLKVLTRITEPTVGEAWVWGRVGSLLEVGTGFHPELTGRENIFLNGAILGMKRTEVRRKFDEIVEFAGVERFVDTPVKHYSSGMYMRLAFAVAANLDTEVLLVDEVLSVGDIGFQNRCLSKMQDVTSSEGRTVLFVSHNMAAVRGLCTEAMLLRQGRIAEYGNTEDVINAYFVEQEQVTSVALEERTDREGSGEIRLTGIRCGVAGAGEAAAILSGSDVEFQVDYASSQNVINPTFHIALFNQYGVHVTHFCTTTAGLYIESPQPRGQLACEVPNLPLPPGRYHAEVSVMDGAGHVVDRVHDALAFEVQVGDFFGTGHISVENQRAQVLVPHRWEHTA